MDNTRTITMSFIKKYRLKKKLKKAIDYLKTLEESHPYHYMCLTLDHFNIDRNDIPEFNYESFKEFIEIHYPELTPYLARGYTMSVIPSLLPWMEEDDDDYYPDEQITQAKKHYLCYIMATL